VNDPREIVRKLCSETLSPLVRADGGELHLVSATAEDVHLHLSGTCSGCPGAAFTRDRMLEPALQAVIPKIRLRLTTGVRIPDGAEKFE
jgi:Fe-S cluster biogenesis protein NfuA